MAYLIAGTSSISQGSIVDGVDWGLDVNPLGIVLSNECDIRNGKLSYVVLAALIPARATIIDSEEFKNKTMGIEDKVVSNKRFVPIKNFLDGYIYNKGVTRYYFIDPKDAIEAPYLFVDFQHLISMPIETAQTFVVVAKLPSPYVEQMMVQFASYIARIPTERQEDTTAIIDDIIEPFKRA